MMAPLNPVDCLVGCPLQVMESVTNTSFNTPVNLQALHTADALLGNSIELHTRRAKLAVPPLLALTVKSPCCIISGCCYRSLEYSCTSLCHFNCVPIGGPAVLDELFLLPVARRHCQPVFPMCSPAEWAARPC